MEMTDDRKQLREKGEVSYAGVPEASACGVLMSGGEAGLYRCGGASDSTNLDGVMGFDKRQLLVSIESQKSH